VQGGFPAIVDGAFLQRRQRDMFRELAAQRGVPFAIVDCVASAAALRARVTARALAGNDASEADLAVLEHQLRTAEPLSREELRFAIAYDADAPAALSQHAWRSLDHIVRGNASSGGQS
jgi:predicted kinase